MIFKDAVSAELLEISSCVTAAADVPSLVPLIGRFSEVAAWILCPKRKEVKVHGGGKLGRCTRPRKTATANSDPLKQGLFCLAVGHTSSNIRNSCFKAPAGH